MFQVERSENTLMLPGMVRVMKGAIRSLQQSSFRSFDVYEGREILKMQTPARLTRDGATVILLRI